MKKQAIFSLFIAAALLLSACSGNSRQDEGGIPAQGPEKPEHGEVEVPQEGVTPPAAETETAPAETVVIDTSNIFSNRDFETDYTEERSAVISLTGDSASCTSNAVQISGSTVTIIDEGTYILSGTLNNGMIVVNANKQDKTRLVLDGVSVHSETCAAIYILQADKVFITLAEGSENTLSNGGTFTAIDENNIDAAVFSKEDITFNGTGALSVSSPAGHGIVSKDSLTFTGGTYEISAASHGIDGKDDVCVADGSFTITSGKDGIHAENEDDASLGFLYIKNGVFSLEAAGDGLSASASARIDAGSFSIRSGGGSENAEEKASSGWGGFGKRPEPQQETVETETVSGKGIKGAAGVFIYGGSFEIDAADDAVHANTDVTVSGGTFCIASGDDAFHADTALDISAGSITVSECYEGLEGLHVTVSGGDIRVKASDDGINAAGGMDSSGFGGIRGGDRFGGGMPPMRPGGKGDMPGMKDRDGASTDTEGKGGMPGGMMGGSGSGGSILISGGTVHLDAGGDCVDANGTLEITGGTVSVCSAMQGDTSVLDYDRSAVIRGGVFAGTGIAMMAQTFSESEQGVITLRLGSTQAAGSEILVADEQGNAVFSCAPEGDYYYVIVSTPELVKGEEYSVTAGRSQRTVTAD